VFSDDDVAPIDARTIDADLTPPPDSNPNIPDANPVIPDANPPGPCDLWSYKPSNLACTDPTGSWAVSVSDTYDTTSGTSLLGGAPVGAVVAQDSGGGNVRVISLDAFTVAAGQTLRVVGSMPLIVLVHGAVTIAGTVDASGEATTHGPGGNDVVCVGAGLGGDGGDTADVTGGGGAGGGGFGAVGFAGGASVAAGGTAGGMPVTPAVVPLRGGCSGGLGGEGAGTNGTGPGLPGGGGGGVQISGRDSLTIAGAVMAGGGGGRGGNGADVNAGEGAGGGGSGGGILLEGPTVTISGALCANGGGGGEGSGMTNNGNPGGNALCAAAPALGGSLGTTTGGDGGNGGFSSTAAAVGGPPMVAGSGGGGGGGAIGVIHLRGAVGGTPIVVTPTASVSTL
jgi:hypothetical protein